MSMQQLILMVIGQLTLSGILYMTLVLTSKTRPRVFEVIVVIVLNTFATLLSLIVLSVTGLGAVVSNTIAIIIMTIAANVKVKMWKLSAAYACTAMIVVMVGANFVSGVTAIVNVLIDDRIPIGRGAANDQVLLGIMSLVIILLLSYFISSRVGNMLHKDINKLDASQVSKLAIYLLRGCIATLAIILTLIHLRYEFADPAVITIIYTTGIGLGFGSFLFTVFIFTENMRVEIEALHKNEMLQNLQNYTKRIDALTLDARTFRHDHKNMLLTFRNYINEKNWDELQKLYEDYLAKFTSSTNKADALVHKLNQIKTPEIESILLVKYMQAQQSKIDVTIEVWDAVPLLDDLIMLDVCRMIGIFFDNAIEACSGLEGASIQILVSNQEGGFLFVIENTSTTKATIEEIHRRRYTVKKGERGLGLVKAAQIIAENPRISLKTSNANGIFTQKLLVNA